MTAGPFSLRSHLALVVLGAVLPCALLTGLIVRRTLAESRAVIEHRLVDAARVDAASLDREFNAAIRVLDTMAQSPSLDAGDLRAFHAEAIRAQRTQPGWFAVILLTPDGQQLLHTDVPFGEPLRRATEPASLQQLIATHAPVVGALTAGQRDPKLRFPIRVPVDRDGQLRYVLTAVMEPEWLTTVIRTQLPETEEWTRTIVDPAFQIASRSRGSGEFVGRAVSAEGRQRVSNPPDRPYLATSLEGEPLYSVLRRGRYGWTTSVSVPAAVLDGPVRASIVAIVSGAALLVLAGLVSVLIVSRRVSRDLADARGAAAVLAEGHTPPPARVRVAETQQVHASLARAAGLLQERARERDEQLQRAITAQARAEDASRTKDQFLAVLGHELRNPLAPALTALELMKLKGSGGLHREREVLERQLTHMNRLVDDLLDVSRLTRGKVELVTSRFELRAAVDRAVDMARPLIAQHGHRLQVWVADTGLPLDADQDRIIQVLVNLLTNAARYTADGGRIQIEAHPAGASVDIAVEDDGPGILPELLPTIFEPFAQGPRTLDRHQGGLGLGLALARTLTELHHGTIRYVPITPHGSRFVVTLPMATGPVVPLPAAEPVRIAATRPRRILLVEDNDDGRTMLEEALTGAGHQVQVAADAHTALALAATELPDVAVLDIGLPGMDGYELARRLRAQSREICLIALTGYGQAADAHAALAAGFDTHCTKPITVSVLLDRIQSAACGS